jgi:4-hydroxybenzoate polyprenyltransferase
VVYGSGFDIKVTGPEGRVPGETFSYAGKLAVTFNAAGNSSYMLRIESSYALPVITVAVWVLSSACVVYNILKNRKTDRVVPNA